MSPLRIRIRDDGPIVVEGPAEVVDAEGRVFQLPGNKPGIALCRCGQSQNKPFCDGSHRGCFQSICRAGTGPENSS